MAHRIGKTLALSLGTLILETSLVFAGTPGTVTAVDDKGVATVKMADGKEYKVSHGDMWKVGTKVECTVKDGKAECKQPQ